MLTHEKQVKIYSIPMDSFVRAVEALSKPPGSVEAPVRVTLPLLPELPDGARILGGFWSVERQAVSLLVAHSDFPEVGVEGPEIVASNFEMMEFDVLPIVDGTRNG